MSFSSDGTRIVSGSRDTVRVWRLDSPDSKTAERVFEGHSESVDSVSFSPDGTRIGSGSDDNTVRVWETATGRCLAVFECPGPVRAVWWDPKDTPDRIAAAAIVGDHRGKFPVAWFFTLAGHSNEQAEAVDSLGQIIRERGHSLEGRDMVRAGKTAEEAEREGFA